MKKSCAWNAALATLPSDWSDLYGEVELRSSRDLERAALALSPLNPSAAAGRPGFRFRVARRFGYGASPEMTRRSREAWTRFQQAFDELMRAPPPAADHAYFNKLEPSLVELEQVTDEITAINQDGTVVAAYDVLTMVATKEGASK